MPQVNCPCGKPIVIEFDAGEASRDVACPHCYSENWADRADINDPPIKSGKVLTLRADGTSSVAEDHG